MKRALTVAAARVLLALAIFSGFCAYHFGSLLDLSVNVLAVEAALIAVAFALTAILFSARSHELWISRIECRVARY